MKLPASIAAIGRVDEARVRKVAADNPDLLHNRLAQRFGISTARLRKILGVSNAAELLHSRDMPAAHYPRKLTYTQQGTNNHFRFLNRVDAMRKKLRAQEDGARISFRDGPFKPMRRPNGRGGPGDEDSR